MRVLVVGADGYIGNAVASHLYNINYDVIGTTRRQVKRDTSYPTIFLDLSKDIPDFSDFDVAVICAAISSFRECEENPKLAWRINVDAPCEIAKKLKPRTGRLIYLSTSAVFDCQSPHRREDEEAKPISAYGCVKAAGEQALIACGERHTVLRMTKVLSPGEGIFSLWVNQLKSGKDIEAISDHFFCPISIEDVISAISALLSTPLHGVVHISGERDISYFDAALFFAHNLASLSNVHSITASSRNITKDQITLFTSLSVKRILEIIDFVPPHPFETLKRIYIEQAK